MQYAHPLPFTKTLLTSTVCDEHHTLTLKDIRRIIHDVLTHQVTIRTDASSGAFSKTEQIANKIIRHNGLSR